MADGGVLLLVFWTIDDGPRAGCDGLEKGDTKEFSARLACDASVVRFGCDDTATKPSTSK
jgi:hypothetical protein